MCPGTHPYTYAENDPVNKSDPGGEFTLGEVGAASVVLGVLAGLAHYAYKGNTVQAVCFGFEVGLIVGFVGTLGAEPAAGEVEFLDAAIYPYCQDLPMTTEPAN